jgi:protein pelota
MKTLAKDLKHNTLKVKIDNLDDLWVLARIISQGDVVEGNTTRIVKKGGDDEGKRKKMHIKLNVEKVEFQKFGNDLRVLGTIIEASNPDVSHGDHHTVTLEPGSRISIIKEFKQWELERIKNAEESSKRPRVLLCAADYGEAAFAVLREFGIEHITELTQSLPGKKKEAMKLYQKSREDFLVELAKMLQEISENQNINKVILGGVGFLIDNIKDLLIKFPDLKKKLHTVKISTSGKPGINELIKRGVVDKVAEGSRISQETKEVDRFFAEVAKDGLATYGQNEVKKSIDYGAAELIMISEDYIQKAKDKGKFENLDKLMKDAEKVGAKIMIISEEHEAGEKFAKMGVAAILRFKIE